MNETSFHLSGVYKSIKYHVTDFECTLQQDDNYQTQKSEINHSLTCLRIKQLGIVTHNHYGAVK